MEPAANVFEAYKQLLSEGRVQQAYRGIMQFMLQLQTRLKNEQPDFDVSGLYQGYMDMTYLSATPKTLAATGLKIAIVFLHESFCFQIWLGARNRPLQGKYIAYFRKNGWDPAEISKAGPGVDSIIENLLVINPDFENPQALSDQILASSLAFSNKIEAFLNTKGSL